MAKSSSAAASLPADLTFESAMQQLDGLVRQLESGQGSLDEAIQNYEQGARLRAFCEQKLKDAELRIQQIATAVPDHSSGRSRSPDGSVTAAPFHETSGK
jgi:exodeoxyribonuclease VII small subunit